MSLELVEQLRSAAALVYVADLGLPEASREDAHHLLNVLRLRDGEAVIAADGAGGFLPCVARRDRAGDGRTATLRLEAAGEPQLQAPSSPRFTVAFALQKGDRADWTVQKLTEIGVDSIVPLLSERTVVRLEGAERGRRGERLRRIAHEASAQSRRLHLPIVSDPAPFAEVLTDLGGNARLAEPGGVAGLVGCDTLLVGPEGGWSPAELGVGLPTVGLGENVLRAETAAVVAATLLVAARNGLIDLATRK